MAFTLGPQGWAGGCLLVNFVLVHITVSREQENQTEALVEGEGHVREAEQVDILWKRIRDIGIGAKMWMCPMPG